MAAVQFIMLDGKEYVVLPKADYLRLAEREVVVPPDAVDAVAHADATLSANLKRAREAAGLTQAQLASRLGKSQPMVSGAESGRVKVSARYVAAAVKACGLPKDWPSTATKKPQTRSTRRPTP